MKKSIKYLTNYLKGKDKGVYKYFYACLDYLSVYANEGKETALSTVSILYGNQIAKEIEEDFSDNLKIFQYYILPNCPECNNCKLASECREKEVIAIKNRIKQKQSLYRKTQIMTKDDLASADA